jgi:hypothetical protein
MTRRAVSRACGHAIGMKEPWDNIIGRTVTFADGTTKLCTVHICWNCGAWLSLGESNDAPDEVRIEIRAAELAMLSTEQRKRPPYEWSSIHEWLGIDSDEPALYGDAAYQAGHLARCIHDHDHDHITEHGND